VAKGKLEAATRDAALARIDTSTDYQRLAVADFVVLSGARYQQSSLASVIFG
jgi:3-hydroxyacyl-CoA dehydrogenase